MKIVATAASQVVTVIFSEQVYRCFLDEMNEQLKFKLQYDPTI